MSVRAATRPFVGSVNSFEGLAKEVRALRVEVRNRSVVGDVYWGVTLGGVTVGLIGFVCALLLS